jgi:hypothetical protein
MRLHRARIAVGSLCLFAFACLTLADQPGAGSSAQDDQETVKSTGTPKTPAASVNFRKQLDLPFNTLHTLGTRIETARRAHDPVALANAANELAVAEKVSGKKADVTSSQLLKESAELAKLRRQDKELQAVLKVSEQLQAESEDIASMNSILTMTKQQIAADKAAINTNLEPTWSPRTVVVNNYTNQYLDIWVNGNYKVQVAPGMQQTFTIEHRWNPTTLTAYGDADSPTWGPRYIWGRFKKYTWNIN